MALRVAVAGLGTVGGGVINLLKGNSAIIASRCMRPVEVVAAADINKPSADVDMAGITFYDDAVKMAAEADADVVVETIGGYGVALTVTETALSNSKSLVTANKAMLALHGPRLAGLAEEKKVTIGWEAAVGGGIPCIKALKEGLAGNNITYAAGIMNGTCNFILTTMKETGRAFDDVLAEAQAKGYAETPPDLDVDGIDTAHKLALVSAVSNGTLPAFDAVYSEGIRKIGDYDVAKADELGFSIKLLGISSKTADGRVLQRVHPAMIPLTTALGSTHGVVNGLFTMGDFVGPTFTQGRGAGREATASSCVSDIIDIARGNCPPVFGVPVAELMPPVTADMSARVGAYYLRFAGTDTNAVDSALDAAGVPVTSVTADSSYVVAITPDTATETAVTALSLTPESMIRIEGPWE